jgi:DNA-binding NarL/FixJ family response regulator
VRVVVADDSLLVRQGIVALLQDRGVEVLAEVGDAPALHRAVAEHAPDVAVVDIRMPPTLSHEGLDAAVRIREEHPGVAVLVLSQYEEPEFVLRLLGSDVSRVGYLLKEHVFDAATLVDALRRVHDGDVVVDPVLVASLLDRRRRANPLDALTAREREVLGLVAEGLSNKAIAQRIYVAERTVEAHVTQIFSKLQLDEQPDTHRRVLAVLAYLRG